MLIKSFLGDLELAFEKSEKRKAEEKRVAPPEKSLPRITSTDETKETRKPWPPHMCQSGWTCQKIRDWPKPEYRGDSKLDPREVFDFMDDESTASLERHLEKCPECNSFVWNLRLNGFKDDLLKAVEKNSGLDELEKAQTKNSFSERIEGVKGTIHLHSKMRNVWSKKSPDEKKRAFLN